jgi:predicted metal-dependent enzyme (double-stranded beta helix superfamily)
MRSLSMVPLATSLAVVFVLATAQTVQAQPEPIVANPLTDRHTFSDDVAFQVIVTPEGRDKIVVDIEDGSNLVVVEFTIQPGAMFPWHTHPGSVLVAIRQGELVYIYPDDCVERPYPAGTAFVDPGFGNIHMAYNRSDEETVAIATLLGAPAEGAVTVAVDDDQGAAMDAECGIER